MKNPQRSEPERIFFYCCNLLDWVVKIFFWKNVKSFWSKRFVVLSLTTSRFVFHYFGQYSLYFRYSASIAGMCTHKFRNASS